MNEIPEELKDINLEQVIWDSIVEEMKEAHNKQLFDILHMKYNRKMNFVEKLEAGRYWFWECLLEWIWCMTHPEDTGGDFFCHICSDYCKYEEDTYYE